MLTCVTSKVHSRARSTPNEIESESKQAKPQAMGRKSSDLKATTRGPPPRLKNKRKHHPKVERSYDKKKP